MTASLSLSSICHIGSSEVCGRVDTSGLTPMQLGRVNAALDKLFRFSDGEVRSTRAFIEGSHSIVKAESDGMIDYSRTRFNRMDGREQAAYMARLKAKRYYWINGTGVPKIVFDVTREA